MSALTRLPWLRRWFGDRSERAAERYLRRLGFRVVSRNWSCPAGELDLVALDGPCLVFVEVRSTATADPNRPANSVDPGKQRRLTQAALSFLQSKRLRDPVSRFDVVAVSWPDGVPEPTVVHIRHAFEAVGRFQMGC